jgi:hypothetical protein
MLMSNLEEICNMLLTDDLRTFLKTLIIISMLKKRDYDSLLFILSIINCNL